MFYCDFTGNSANSGARAVSPPGNGLETRLCYSMLRVFVCVYLSELLLGVALQSAQVYLHMSECC